jgi:cytochrome c-type biogenesis protein CcmE
VTGGRKPHKRGSAGKKSGPPPGESTATEAPASGPSHTFPSCHAAAIGYLAYLGAISSWQYYLSVDETVVDATSLLGKRIRVSGRIGAGSLTIGETRRDAAFELKGAAHTLRATCCCPMPDNLAEEIDVVVEGVLEADGIRGHKVITRCASKYQQKNAVTRLTSAGHTKQR